MTTSPVTPPNDSTRGAPANRVLWKWSGAFAALLLVFMMWRCGSSLMQGQKLADAAVRHFHEQLNAGDFEAVYREADEGFRTRQSQDQSLKFLETVHRKLGLAAEETRLNVRVETNTRGTFITTQYSTMFGTGSATETFTWVESNGTLRLNAYRIQSNALILGSKTGDRGQSGGSLSPASRQMERCLNHPCGTRPPTLSHFASFAKIVTRLPTSSICDTRPVPPALGSASDVGSSLRNYATNALKIVGKTASKLQNKGLSRARSAI